MMPENRRNDDFRCFSSVVLGCFLPRPETSNESLKRRTETEFSGKGRIGLLHLALIVEQKSPKMHCLIERLLDFYC